MTTNLETVAAQRDELAAKLRAMGVELEAARAEIARLKGATSIGMRVASEVPSATPPKSKRSRIFGSRWWREP